MNRKEILAAIPESKWDSFLDRLCALLSLDPQELWGPSSAFLLALIGADNKTLLHAVMEELNK